jgi:hypothetical protein
MSCYVAAMLAYRIASMGAVCGLLVVSGCPEDASDSMAHATGSDSMAHADGTAGLDIDIDTDTDEMSTFS